MAKIIELEFDGYYKEADLPPQGHDGAGIYIVYKGSQESLIELLYIGRTGDMTSRPDSAHHKYQHWRRRLQRGELLYFTFADTEYEKRAEAALIYEVQPVCNDTGKDGFHHPKTTILTSGKNAGLRPIFTVQSTDE